MRLPFNLFSFMEVYLIRHTPVANGKDICYGQSNIPLAETFLHDTAHLKNQLPLEFDAVYCSPLLRCQKLAKALGYENIQLENALLEMNFGQWENKKWNEINQDDLNNWMADFINIKTPNGENLLELFERVKLFMENLRQQKHEKTLIISHAGVIRCIWAYLLEIPLQNIFKIPVDYGQVMIFNIEENNQLDSIRRIA